MNMQNAAKFLYSTFMPLCVSVTKNTAVTVLFLDVFYPITKNNMFHKYKRATLSGVKLPLSDYKWRLMHKMQEYD